jgi:hypothetical protein
LVFSRFALLCSLSGAALVGAAVFSSTSGANQSYATLVLVLVFSSLALWVMTDPSFKTIKIEQSVALAVGLGALGLAIEPLLEDDHFRYLWDGYVLATHATVYAAPPEAYFGDSSVPNSMQVILNGVSHPDLVTIYGPLLQGVFAASYLIAPAKLWPLKLFLLGAFVLTLAQLHKTGCKPRWIILLVVNPLVVKEMTLSAHTDGLIGLMILSAVIAWHDGRFTQSVAWVSCTVALKLSCFVLVPLFFFNHKGQFKPLLVFVSVGLLASIYWVQFALMSGSEIPGLIAFGQRWVFNPLLYRLYEPFFALQTAKILASGLFCCAYLSCFGYSLSQLRSGQKSVLAPAIVVILLAMLILSPVNNPWYWLWVLPLAGLIQNRLVYLVALSSLLSYAHVLGADFVVPPWATAAQLMVLAVMSLPLLKKPWKFCEK